MADFSNPALPLVVGAQTGDSYGYNALGTHAILSKIDANTASDTRAEALRAQCDLGRSVAEVGFAVRENKFELKQTECQLDHRIKEDGERTRDVIRAGFQRQDDQLIADLRLQLALVKQSCCPCAPAPVAA